MRGIHRWPVNSPHKWPVTRKIFPFDDVIMYFCCVLSEKISTTRVLSALTLQIYAHSNQNKYFLVGSHHGGTFIQDFTQLTLNWGHRWIITFKVLCRMTYPNHKLSISIINLGWLNLYRDNLRFEMLKCYGNWQVYLYTSNHTYDKQ